MIQAKILTDSITDGGSRLVTWEWTYPRAIHAEVLTHRALSRNSASSRAIPAKVLRQRVRENPFVPIHWGANQKGMQAGAEIENTPAALDWWLDGLAKMTSHHAAGELLGLHKQIVNRVIEPWMLITVIVSATDHANLFHLRKHGAAEPHFQELARQCWDLYHEHMPSYLAPGSWHLPMIEESDWDATTNGHTLEAFDRAELELRKVSVGRCARVSYLTHDGRRDLSEDVRLHDQLAQTATLGADPMHASPFEHVAIAIGGRERHGNFEGFRQYRKFFPHENGPDTSDRCDRCGCWGGRHVRGCP